MTTTVLRNPSALATRARQIAAQAEFDAATADLDRLYAALTAARIRRTKAWRRLAILATEATRQVRPAHNQPTGDASA